MKHGLIAILVVTVITGMIFTAGCQTDKQNKALLGGAVGAGVGYAISGDAKGTAIGAGVGAGTGYVVGRDEPKQQAPQQGYSQPPQQNYQTSSAGASSVSVWVTNSNGSQTEVKLTRNADGSYTGPKGERYPTMPTEQQLKQAYGF